MSNGVLWLVVFFIIGLIVGLVIAWFYWRQRTQAYEAQILSLQRSLVLKDQSEQALQKRLKEQEDGIVDLRGQVRQQEEERPHSPAKFEEQAPVMRRSGDIAPIESPVDLPEPNPDDLKRVEGIGPKISSVLNEAGITTFSMLANSNGGQLERIISDAGIKLADPSTWPEQATLAATDDWEGLAKLQDQLKGGRRV